MSSMFMRRRQRSMPRRRCWRARYYGERTRARAQSYNEACHYARDGAPAMRFKEANMLPAFAGDRVRVQSGAHYIFFFRLML